MNSSGGRGQIITFYSYKGGTGRSMALANIACILADRETQNNGKGVLMIDWDLEAPGLHRYFRGRLTTSRLGMENIDRRENYDSSPGLIDLFYELDKNVNSYIEEHKDKKDTLATEQAAFDVLSHVDISSFTLSTTIRGLSLLKAGRFASRDPNEYSERVNKFNWEALFKKSPHLIRVFGETLARKYSYVLIDSRTGITDISGLTTMLLPEKLVIVFTPNLQSLKGGLELVTKATEYRKESVDLRPLTIFPLVSRVEVTEPELRHEWRFGNEEIVGFQPEFEKVLSTVYGERVKLHRYFEGVQIQHIPKYAYGEQIAVLVEKTSDVFSLRARYQAFATKLIESHSPWHGEIQESSDFGPRTSSLVDIGNALFDILSLKRASKAVRMMVTLLMILGLGSAIIISALLMEANSETLLQQQQVELSELKNQELQKKVDELEDPIRGILAENNKRIDELVKQVSDVSTARDEADKKAQVAQDQAAQSKLQAERALQAKEQTQAELTVAKADIQTTSEAYKDVMNKYVVAQREVRRLQSDLAKCRP